MVNYKSPFANFEKTKFQLNTDMYINQAINAVFDADKFGLEPGHSFKDGLVMKCITVDQLENVALGLNLINFGIDEDTNAPYPYQAALNSWREENPAPGEDEKEETKLLHKVKFATFRFRIILNSIKQSTPANIDFTLG